MSNGRILEGSKKLKSNCKKWSSSQLSTLKSSWSSACNHQKECYFMDPLGVVRPYLLKQLQVNAVLTLFQSKVLSYWLCGSVRVKQTLEMCLTRLELLLLASYSSISWTPLQCQEAQAKVMLEVQVTESSISSWQKWTVLEPRRTSSLLEQPTDHRLWIRPYWDLYFICYLGTSRSTYLYSIAWSSFSPQYP